MMTSIQNKMRPWQWMGLIAVLLLSIGLHFIALNKEGYGNLYYAAAVSSMRLSSYNLFFASFDPAGYVSVDKPPLGLITQVFSTAIFGFNGWSLIFPQALCGVLGVLLLFHLVHRTFGANAGLAAALILSLSPIYMAANRNNTMDSQLLLILLLAAWAALKATEKGSPGWLLASTALVGAGFNIKMLQAYMVLPAIYFTYLLAARCTWWKRFVHASLTIPLLVVISMAWAVLVDLTPTNLRPYVGSSQDNSVMELIIGHNGLTRLGPLAGIIGITPGRTTTGPQPPARTFDPPPNRPQPVYPGRPPAAPYSQPGGQGNFPPPGQLPAGPGGMQPGANSLDNETGNAGLLRLFNRQLAGQISWLLPLALLGFLAAFLQNKPFSLQTPQCQSLLLWIFWLVPQVIFFSFAGLFHRYYLEMLAPAIAALCGAGLTGLWAAYQQSGIRRWFLPAVMLITGVNEVFILSRYSEWILFLIFIVTLVTALSAVLLLLPVLRKSVTPEKTAAMRDVQKGITLAGFCALLLPPFIWSLTPLIAGGDVNLPHAGPELFQENRTGNDLPDYSKLITYLDTNYDGEAFYLATPDVRTAAPIILQSGQSVMAIGGFSGSDPILKTDQLAQLIQEKSVRFFFVQGVDGKEADKWAQRNCRAIQTDLWQTPRNETRSFPSLPLNAYQLFDCRDRNK